jgi:small subunit ribosomal protein S8
MRNAIAVRKSEIVLPHSNIKESVARLLQNTNFIEDVKVTKDGTFKKLVIKINNDDDNARISEIVRISKPGRRYYVNSREIPVVKRGRGVIIISTSKGIMTGADAQRQNIGGELICKVY